MNLYEFEQTCGMYPSQWEARDEQGNDILIHFRHNRLTVYRFDGSENDHLPIFVQQQVTEAPEAGVMDTEEMLSRTGYMVQ